MLLRIDEGSFESYFQKQWLFLQKNLEQFWWFSFSQTAKQLSLMFQTVVMFCLSSQSLANFLQQNIPLVSSQYKPHLVLFTEEDMRT